MTNVEVSKNILFRPKMDRILDSMCSRHRRLILLLLKHGSVETEADMMVRGGNNIEEIEKNLTRNHLPRLEEAGYIEWNRDTGEISKGPRFDELKPLLELIENHADELPDGWP
ncbi:MAG: hypothetical protein ACLFNI_12080 [Natronomonas sp.]